MPIITNVFSVMGSTCGIWSCLILNISYYASTNLSLYFTSISITTNPEIFIGLILCPFRRVAIEGFFLKPITYLVRYGFHPEEQSLNPIRKYLVTLMELLPLFCHWTYPATV